jgi:polar amino acid transport system substrate-binding protein
VAAFALATSIILVATFAFRLASLSSTEPLEPILLATGEWAPYSGSALPRNGLASAIVSAVFQRMGYEPRYRFMPWVRTEESTLLNDSNRGVRAAFPYARDEQRGANFYYSDPILTIPLRVFFNAGTNPSGATIAQIGDLQRVKVVPISGYRYAPEVQRFVDARKPVENTAAAFELLLTSPEPLVVIEAPRVAEEALNGDLARSAQRIAHAPLVIPSPIHLIASKRNPNNLGLIRDFNQHLDALRRDGTLDQIEVDLATAMDADRTVRLEPITPGAAIEAFETLASQERVLLPNGTRAVVEKWSNSYLLAAPGAAPAERALVRILNGPQRGRHLYVDSRTIRLTP